MQLLRLEFTWYVVLIMVVGWMFGGFGCHAAIKGAELSFNLGYLIMAALFHPVHPGIIHMVSTFRGNYPHFLDISVFCGYSLHILDIVDISAFRGYYLCWSHYKLLSL